MPSIWDMLFPGASQAPQFADPNGNPNAQLPVPPQQAPYFGAQMNAQQPAPQAPWLPQTTPWPQDAAPLTAQQRYRAAQAGDESRMPQFQRTGPTLPGMIAQSMEDTGRMMTTAPPAMPRGAYMDAGGPAQGTADPQEFANWLGEMRQRRDLAPSMALGMIGGGTAFAPRSALGAAGGAKMLQPTAEATEAVQPGIRAYHSSPHDFDQFDLSKIGTGEGAQAYGHGIYFAESPAVSGQGGQYWKSFFDRTQGPEKLAADFLHANDFDRKAAADALRTQMAAPGGVRNVGQAGNASDAEARSALAMLKSGQPVGPRTYEVNIGAPPEQFLDWDKPLSQQHPQVQDALKQALGPNWEQFKSAKAGDAVKKGFIAPGEETTAAQLHQAGIPGIRYLDQGSRNLPPPRIEKVEGGHAVFWGNDPKPVDTFKTLDEAKDAARQIDTTTRNYVVFDPKMIEILRKYGIAGLLSSGAASQLPIPPQKAPVF